MLTFSCSHCGQLLNTREDTAGKKVKCPKCAQIVSVPSAPAPAAALIPSNRNDTGPKLTEPAPVRAGHAEFQAPPPADPGPQLTSSTRKIALAGKRKQCFVISPIGQDGSEERRHANLVFKHIIEDALRGYGFDIIRADQITSPGRITDDMVAYIQNAELCIVVLTGHNPNVYYECGRRHETGRPCIHIIEKGQAALFDLKDFRSVQYDLSSLDGASESREKLRQAIDYFEQSESGYGQTTRSSLEEINDSLKRIDRRIESILTRIVGTISGSPQQDGLDREDHLDPRKGFLKASKRGNIRKCALFLPLLADRLGPTNKEYIAAAGIVAGAGVETGALHLLRAFEEHADELTADLKREVIGSLVHYYNLTDKELEGVPRITPLVEAILGKENLSPREQAWYLNQLGKLFHGAGAFEQALAASQRVLELIQDDASYWYNASLILKAMNRHDESLEYIDKYMSLENAQKDPDHLEHAIQAYVRGGRLEDARRAFAELAEVEPEHDLITDDTLRRALGI